MNDFFMYLLVFIKIRSINHKGKNLTKIALKYGYKILIKENMFVF